MMLLRLSVCVMVGGVLPFIRDGGESGNNIVLAAGEDFLEFEISEGMAATMNGESETALIIGGDITITKDSD